MEFLQQIDPAIAIWLTIGCSLLCVVFFVVSFLMQFLGFGLEILGMGFGFIMNIITGGPAVWCGCFLFIGFVGLCGLTTWGLYTIMPNCGTPDAVNLCRFLGY